MTTYEQVMTVTREGRGRFPHQASGNREDRDPDQNPNQKW
jgi:hypothetical protein